MKVLLTGAGGAFGTSFVRSWQEQRRDDELIPVRRAEVDLLNQADVRRAIERHQPDAIVHAAAHVDGISAQVAQPTSYLLDNIMMDSHVISAALSVGVPEFLYVSSATIYPRGLRQPLVEEDILTGPFESENEGYALAKLTGAKLCELISREHGLSYRAVVPSNLYGPVLSHNLSTLHMIAAALEKVHAAVVNGEATVNIWGDGLARREFTFMSDVTQWLVAQVGSLASWPALLNLGQGEDHSINDYYEWAKQISGFTGDFSHDLSAPVGVQQRLLDSSKARQLGWQPQTSIVDGMTQTYRSMFAEGSHVSH